MLKKQNKPIGRVLKFLSVLLSLALLICAFAGISVMAQGALGNLIVKSPIGKNEKCVWEEQLACAEIKVGDGNIIISTIDVSGKENNPVMAKFLNNLAK